MARDGGGWQPGEGGETARPFRQRQQQRLSSILTAHSVVVTGAAPRNKTQNNARRNVTAVPFEQPTHSTNPSAAGLRSGSGVKSSFASDYAWFRKQRSDSRYDACVRARAARWSCPGTVIRAFHENLITSRALARSYAPGILADRSIADLR